ADVRIRLLLGCHGSPGKMSRAVGVAQGACRARAVYRSPGSGSRLNVRARSPRAPSPPGRRSPGVSTERRAADTRLAAYGANPYAGLKAARPHPGRLR